MKTFGYMRVSTDDQTFALQEQALNEFGCDHIFRDKMTGARMDRPGLMQALKTCRAGDRLAVWKLDRLGRSTVGVIDAVTSLNDREIELVSLSEQIDTTTPMGKMFLSIMAAMAQLERDLISERTKAGIAARRAKGLPSGKPHFIKDYPLRLARFRELWPLIHDGEISGADVVQEMREADPDAPEIKSVQSFYNWKNGTKRNDYRKWEGFEPDAPLGDVEEDDKEQGQ